MTDLTEAIKNIKSLDQLKTVIESYGITFNKNNMCKCPFHEDDTESFSIKDKGTGAFYKCFGCEDKQTGDIITFIQKQENLSTLEATKRAYEILGLPLELKGSNNDKLGNFINFIKNGKGMELKDGLYKYENNYVYYSLENNPHYIKVKFRNHENNKKYFITKSLVETKYSYKYGEKEDFDKLEKVIYNLPKVKEAINKNNNVYFVEGEKDADTLNRLGFTATTIYVDTTDEKVWDKYRTQLQNAKIISIADTGEKGKKFQKNVWEHLKDVVQSFKIVDLQGLKELGDNKDVTDWLEAGHTNEELIEAINRSLDLLNENELQQDEYGIHSIWYKKEILDGEEILTRMKTYLTDFNILGAKILRNIDTNDQDIELKIKNALGKETTINANARELFNDLKTFRSALGIDYNFLGKKVEQLIRLKRWIVKYFITDDIQNYKITGIRKINGEYALVTNNGILYKDGRWDTSIKADNISHDINFTDIEPLTKEEADKLASHLFTFNSKTVVYNTLGCAIAHMLNAYARESTKDNLPILFDIGESNAGKTKAQNIIKLLYNNTKGSLGFNVSTAYAIQKAMGETYLPIFIDEIKPSKDGMNKKKQLGQLIRTATEDHFNLKGTKSQNYKTYETYSTLILTGEDGTEETAAINRTNMVRYARINFDDVGKESIDFLCNSSEGQLLLRKLSKHLYLHVLNEWNPEILEQRYDEVKNNIGYNLNSLKDDRMQKTAIYTILGLEILDDVFLNLGVDLTNMGISPLLASMYVIENLIEELNDGLDETLAEYEKILQDIDHIAGNVDVGIKIKEDFDYRTLEDGNLAIIVPSVWDKLERYYKTNKSESIPLTNNMFTKSLRVSKYFVDYKPVKFTFFVEAKDGSTHAAKKAKRAFILNKEALKGLNLENLIDEDEPKEGKVIQIRPEYIQKDFNEDTF